MPQLLKTFCDDESGATAMEYGLILALVAAVIIGALQMLDAQLLHRWQEIADFVASA